MPSLRSSRIPIALSTLFLACLAFTAGGDAVDTSADASADTRIDTEAGSEIFRSPRTAVQLVAEQRSVQAGEPVRVGLRFDMAEHWHVYWRNPGDSGTAPSVEWTLPDGWTAGEFQWPVPERIPVGPFVNFGYEGEIVLPVRLVPAGDPEMEHVEIVADAEWLVCREECIPESARFNLSLPVAESAPEPSAWASLFADADSRQPVDVPGIVSTVRDPGDGTLELEVRYPEGLELADAAIDFLPADASAVEHAADIGVDTATGRAADDRRLRLTLQRSPFADGAVRSLDGVLVASSRDARDERTVALAIAAGPADDEASTTADAGGTEAGATDEGAVSGRPGLAAALGLAFLGGMILNLMPCVFPVLSIKVLGLLGHRDDPATGRRHGLLFAAGILVSFWILAGALLGLRAAGNAVGWGFQLQSPAFVGFLALLFFLLALNFLGVFELGQRVAGQAATVAGSVAGTGGGARGAFWSGVLATAIATPCTAPFMGSAVGFAAVVRPPAALAVFTALGLGMAAPYVALVYFPAALRRLPRPGPWMETLKELMAFPLFATVLWLLWVLAAQRGTTGVFTVLAALLFAGFAAWLVPRLGGVRPRALWLAGVALAALSAGSAAALVLSPTFLGAGEGAVTANATGSGSETVGDSDLAWQEWSPELVDRLRADGRAVYVDFTARWCLTCQVNKRVVFGSDRVVRAFEQRDIALVRADWTNQDPRITAALEAHGRSGVPLNLFYPAEADAPPTVLPTVLSPEIVLQAIDLDHTNHTTGKTTS